MRDPHSEGRAGRKGCTLSLSPLCSALFCDYYNREGQCEWHYQPCGAPCMRTCRNPSGHCQMDLPGLEGERQGGARAAGRPPGSTSSGH